jgi:hypothetical protein
MVPPTSRGCARAPDLLHRPPRHRGEFARRVASSPDRGYRSGDAERARVAHRALAVPMSMPRYTSAESTLTISNGSSSPGASQDPTCPPRSGPSTGRATPRLRSLINARAGTADRDRERQPHPGRAAVIALVGALGTLHFAQQGVHFREAQIALRAHGRMAGHGGEQVIDRLLDAARVPLLQKSDSTSRTMPAGSRPASRVGMARSAS